MPERGMSALGQKQTFAVQKSVSALLSKADMSMSALCQKQTWAACAGLLRVVENDANGVPESGADAAYAVPEIDAIVALRSLNRPVVDGKDYRVALSQRHNLGPALHARPLLG